MSTVTTDEAQEVMEQIGEANSIEAIAEILEALVESKVNEALNEHDSQMHKSWKDKL